MDSAPLFTSDHRAELHALIAARSVRTGTFTLASGRTSDFYFNGKPTVLHPRGAELVARAILDIARGLDVTHLSGLEVGAVSIIGALAALSSIEGTPLQASFVRKAPKAHGTGELIEGVAPGETLEGVRVLIVEDANTSGGSILKAAAAIRGAGGIVEHAAVLVERGEGGGEALAAQGIGVHSVFTARDFVSAG